MKLEWDSMKPFDVHVGEHVFTIAPRFSPPRTRFVQGLNRLGDRTRPRFIRIETELSTKDIVFPDVNRLGICEYHDSNCGVFITSISTTIARTLNNNGKVSLVTKESVMPISITESAETDVTENAATGPDETFGPREDF